MSLYIVPITKLRKQEITSSEINYKFHEPYCWFHYFISEAIKSNSKYILFQEEQEREFGGMNSDYWTDYFIELNKRLIENDITLVIAFSGYPKESIYSWQEKYLNIKVYNTPLYFLNFLYYLDKQIIEDLSQKIKNVKFEKLFITLNNKPHPSRCSLIDYLCKYNLLNLGTYSWLKDGEVNYKFDCFDNEYKKLNYTQKNSGRDYYWKDLLYGNPLINLVTESDDSKIGISEKTCKPLLIGQPFIVYSQKGFHKVLQEFGFELYDEIFDYSFDLLDSPKDRMKGICDNLNNLKDKDLLKLYKSISHKLEKNKQTALDIIKNKKFIDKEYLELLINNKEQFQDEISTFNFFNLDN